MRNRMNGANVDEMTFDEWLFRPPSLRLAAADADRVRHLGGELADGFRALAQVGHAVSVFGSTRTKPEEPAYRLAVDVAREIASRGVAIITGGGPGIMEAANRGAREVGALSIGLSIELPAPQQLNAYVDLEVSFRHFFIRKLMFVRYASAFIVFPGGFGTLDELFEAATLLETGKIATFPVVLVGSSYWSGLVAWMRSRSLTEGKIDAADLDLLHVCDDPKEIAEIVMSHDARRIPLTGLDAASR